MDFSQKEIEIENFRLFDGYIHIWLEGKEKIYPFTNVMEINVEKYEGVYGADIYSVSSHGEPHPGSQCHYSAYVYQNLNFSNYDYLCFSSKYGMTGKSGVTNSKYIYVYIDGVLNQSNRIYNDSWILENISISKLSNNHQLKFKFEGETHTSQTGWSYWDFYLDNIYLSNIPCGFVSSVPYFTSVYPSNNSYISNFSINNSFYIMDDNDSINVNVTFHHVGGSSFYSYFLEKVPFLFS